MKNTTLLPEHLAQGPRIAWLESIRGLAALQVLLLHFFGAFAPGLVFAVPAGSAVLNHIHLSPLFFLYDGYSAVYIFFALSGYVLTRSFEREVARPFSVIAGRIVRLGLPAVAATVIAAAALAAFGRPNAQVGLLLGSDWFASQWNPALSLTSIAKDGIGNALFLGYAGLPGVAFLAPWQQPVEQSFAAPLWTLSIELYGSMVVLGLCLVRRSRAFWWAAMVLGAVFAVRSAYICFFIGHAAAAWRVAEKPAAAGTLIPISSIIAGVLVCVLAETWQPEWLRALCIHPTALLFPGQFAPMQQKTFGAILVLAGLVNLEAARNLLSTRWLVAGAKLSFPVYLTHWPVLFGPSAAAFLLLDRVVAPGFAAVCAMAIGMMLTLAIAVLFLRVDRSALKLSSRLRKPASGMLRAPPPLVAKGASSLMAR